MRKTTIHLLAVGGTAIAVPLSHHAFAAPTGVTAVGALRHGSIDFAEAFPVVRASLVPRRVRCGFACRPGKGFLACVARCVKTKEVCDSGLRNCTRL